MSDEPYDWLQPLPALSRITDGMYMGAFPDGKVHFDLVVNCHTEPHDYGRMHVHFPFDDGPTVPRRELLLPLGKLIHDVARHGTVLVHCRVGINRSGLLCALALMHANVSAEWAIARLRRMRSDNVLSNRHFEQFLLALHRIPQD